MKLSKLTAGLPRYQVEYKTGAWDREIKAITADTRTIKKGALFICLQGENVDGHAFAAQAEKQGAAAIVVQRPCKVNLPQIVVPNTRSALALLSAVFYQNAHAQLKIIAVTGTNGKTTVSYMLESILRAAGKKVGVIGTLGVRYNGKQNPF